MNPLKLILLFGILLISAIRCRKDTDIGERLNLGESFFIKSQETKIISFAENGDSAIKVQFKGVISDSRCPLSACSQCYGSKATILVFIKSQKDTATLSLDIPGCIEELTANEDSYFRKDTLGYRFYLLKLDPYPTGKAAHYSSYRSKIQITKLF